MLNYTRIPAPRVTIVDPRTGIVSNEWFRFFNNLYAIAYAATGNVTPGTYGSASVVPQITVDDFGTIIGISDVPIAIDASQIVSGTLPAIRGGTGFNSYTDGQLLIGNSTGNTLNKGTLGYGTGLLVTNGAGTVSIGFSDANVATWAATPSSANLAAAMTDETGTGLLVFGTNPTLVSPNINVIDFDTTYATTLTAGQLGWDGNNTLGLGMFGGNVIQHIGEDQFFYCKATSAITKGQVVMFTGAVGASGVPTGAPATGITDGTYIMGIAAEAIALNGFGLVQSFGTLRNINTSGYVDGDILWYDPTVTGGLTKTKPSAPNVKAQMAAVINGGSVGGGTILIRINPGSTLGGTDSNAQINGAANGEIITYDGGNGYWKNTAIVNGTGISVTSSANGVLTITNTSPSSGGTVTSVSGTGTVNGITLTGTVTSSGSLTLGGTLSGIGNSQLTNSTISGVALGGSLFNLTAGTGVSFSTGTTYNGSAAITINATGTGGTVTSVAALTLGTTGTDLSSTVANGTTTPVITLNVPTASSVNRGALSAADWTTFNSKAPGVTFTTGYIPFGQGTTTLNQSANFTYNGTNMALVGSSTSTAFGVGPSITIQNTYGSAFGSGAPLLFGGPSTSVLAGIKGIYTTFGTTYGGALLFGTNAGDGTGLLERARIHRSGGVSIGNTTDPGATNLSVTGTGQFGTTVGVGAATPSTSGAGITFPATQSASTNANTLDDYEEGTWTPTVTPQTGSLTAYSSSATYTKIGRLVYVNGLITITTPGTAAGSMALGAFPFTNGSSNQQSGICREVNSTGVVYQCLISGSATTGAISSLINGAVVWTAGYIYEFALTYYASA